MNDLKRVQKFCDQFTKDGYPDSLKNLEGISEQTRDILTVMVRKEIFDRGAEERDDTELSLINRFLNPRPFLNLTFDKILGPVSVCQMSHPNSKKYPHIFYIFGDQHEKTGVCKTDPSTMSNDMSFWLSRIGSDGRNALTITKWIEYTVSSSPVFIDVYLESPYMYKSFEAASLGTDNYLEDNHNAFHKCLIGKSRFGVCKTSRFHYTDIRKIFTTHNQVEGFHLVMGRDLDWIHSWNKQDAKNAREFYAYFIDPNSLVYQRIQKQFDNIQDNRIKNLLEKDFKTCTARYAKILKEFSPPRANTKLNIVRDKLRDSRDDLLEYANCLMDYYLIARCFRTYRKIKNQYSRPSYNNIMYVGDTHAINYTAILKKLGFKQQYIQRNQEGDKDFQCLDVSGMNQPMFHQRY